MLKALTTKLLFLPQIAQIIGIVGLKAQKHIAWNNALCIWMQIYSPCKGKSFYIVLVLLPLQGDNPPPHST